MKKASYFFILDAFIASVILFITLIAINNSAVEEPIIQTTSFTSNDFIALLANTEIRDFSNSYINELRAAGVITDSRISLIEAIVDLHSGTAPENASLLLDSFTPNLIPAQNGIIVRIDSLQAYQLKNETLQYATSVSTSRTLVLDSETLTTHEVEVVIWI